MEKRFSNNTTDKRRDSNRPFRKTVIDFSRRPLAGGDQVASYPEFRVRHQRSVSGNAILRDGESSSRPKNRTLSMKFVDDPAEGDQRERRVPAGIRARDNGELMKPAEEKIGFLRETAGTFVIPRLRNPVDANFASGRLFHAGSHRMTRGVFPQLIRKKRQRITTLSPGLPGERWKTAVALRTSCRISSGFGANQPVLSTNCGS